MSEKYCGNCRSGQVNEYGGYEQCQRKNGHCQRDDLEFWQPAESPAQSAKADIGKSRADLVSPYLILAVGYIRGYGVEKYHDPDNWKQVEKERYIAALLRHLCEVMKDFESIDPESGFPHLWHVACNVNFLVEMMEAEK